MRNAKNKEVFESLITRNYLRFMPLQKILQ